MTPAIKQLQKQKISFQLHQYKHDVNATSYGLEAGEKLAVASNKIFKTLVTMLDDNRLVVAIVPVDKQLNLKAVAKFFKVKQAKIADTKKVETTTGYILGGVSPLGQNNMIIV